MDNNTDASDQPPVMPSSNPTQQHILDPDLTAILIGDEPATLDEHVKLVIYQLRSLHVYDEELKTVHGVIDKEALCLVANELVLWHYRHDPKAFPRSFEYMVHLAQFCQVLCMYWKPFRQPQSLPLRRPSFTPPESQCGTFRDHAGESVGDRIQRQKLNSGHANIQREADPIRSQGQPVLAQISTGTDTALFFPKFMYMDIGHKLVRLGEIAFLPNVEETLADLTVLHRREHDQFITTENEIVLITTAQWKLYLSRLSEKERRQKGAVRVLEGDELLQKLFVPPFRWDQTFQFLTQLFKRWNEA